MGNRSSYDLVICVSPLSELLSSADTSPLFPISVLPLSLLLAAPANRDGGCSELMSTGNSEGKTLNQELNCR